jgi:hypothetical protein
MKQLALLLAALAVWLGTTGPVAASPPEYLIFSSELRDEGGSAISGVFPLVFTLHNSPTAKRRLWSEQHWVAVEDGVYTVDLAKERRLPRNFDLGTSFIAVSVPKGPEITRVPLTERNIPGFVAKAAAAAVGSPPATAPTTAAAAGAGGPVEYAAKAGVAYEAELSRNCERLENLTLSQVEDRIQKKLGGGAKVGTATRSTGPVGGTGGRHYRLVCPRGYVAVGIEGGAGIYLDSIEVICAPLE